MKKRVISAVVALAIVIPLIILGGTWFTIGCGLLGIVGYYELLSIRETKKKLPFLVKILSIVSFVIIMISSINSLYEFIIDYRLLVIPFIMCLLPILTSVKDDTYNINDALFVIGGAFFLGIAFNFLITIRNLDIYYLIYLLLITIFNDTFGHFFGTQIGKHKLCPRVSPNKTIEGFIGGTVFSTFIGTMFFISIYDYSGSVLLIIAISLLLSIAASLGDLVFSAIKRNYGVKDFGNIMPGHGGILDRTDSIIFACLAFALVISLL